MLQISCVSDITSEMSPVFEGILPFASSLPLLSSSPLSCGVHPPEPNDPLPPSGAAVTPPAPVASLVPPPNRQTQRVH